MPFFTRIRLFQKVAVAILTFFMGLMVIVTFIAYNRRSGATGLDMAKIQQMRYEDSLKNKLITKP